jgi:hypothetical protein
MLSSSTNNQIMFNDQITITRGRGKITKSQDPNVKQSPIIKLQIPDLEFV